MEPPLHGSHQADQAGDWLGVETPYVVIDTSAIHDDFGLSKRETGILLTTAPRQGFQVCVPEVVVMEMAAHCREQIEQTRKNVYAAQGFLRSVLGREIGELYTGAELDRVERTYETSLRRRIRAAGALIIPLPSSTIALRRLCSRERAKRKPFKPDGQGVRDALIWESVLELCRREPQPVVLISRNSRDFASESRDPTVRHQLHAHLLHDLTNLGVPLERSAWFESVAAFNEARLGSAHTAESSQEV